MFDFVKTGTSTTVILCDGLGKGIKANVAANFCLSRLFRLLEDGFTLRDSFARVVRSMNEARFTGMPYAVFTIVRIGNDGNATLLSYEMPAPVYISGSLATVLPGRSRSIEKSVIFEAQFRLNEDDGLLLFSDGIAQAGLGKGLGSGWGSENIARYTTMLLSEKTAAERIAAQVKQKAWELWKQRYEDDCTTLLITGRKGKTINLLTGPPSREELDEKAVETFMSQEGLKIVCGATTAKIVARYLDEELEVDSDSINPVTPPQYYIEGVDLVTEGAVTLTQLLNIWDVPFEKLPKKSVVSDLCAYLQVSHRINFFVGTAENKANEDITFRQMGILNRAAVIPIIRERLLKMGKVVTLTTW